MRVVECDRIALPFHLLVFFQSNNGGQNSVLDAVREIRPPFSPEDVVWSVSMNETIRTDSISGATARMRRYRERRRDGLRCVVVELRETEIDELIRKKFLTPETRNDRNAVLRALYGSIALWPAGRDAQRRITGAGRLETPSPAAGQWRVIGRERYFGALFRRTRSTASYVLCDEP
jgi:hypothetical protein